MTSLSALQSALTPSSLASTAGRNAGSAAASRTTQTQVPAAPQQSTVVTLGANNVSQVADPTYSIPSIGAAAGTVWQVRSNDAVSSLMAGNFFSRSVVNRFSGIGSALLGMLRDGAQGFTQSVALDSSAATALAAVGTQKAAYPQADEKLVVKTKSGVEVEISLSTQDDKLQVQMQSSGELSDAERVALGKLAEGFQDAIDGIGTKPPQLKLAGLTNFDATVLSSVEFHASVTLDSKGPQTLSFNADSVSRSVKLDGPLGTLDVSVDMRDFSIWGNSKQRDAAVNNYLKQFDQAAKRGNADKELMGLFKDAFTQMNSDYVKPEGQQARISLADVDHAMLSGMADFKASVKQVPQSPNPKLLSELDTFAYEASQKTDIAPTNQANRSVSQQQRSRLTASYHMSLVPDVPLVLTADNKSQNYYYKEIDDAADSTVGFSYTKGVLSEAFAIQSAQQSTRTRKYELGTLTDDATSPFNASLKRDILATLKPFLEDLGDKSASEMFDWQQKLEEVHGQILLQSDPAKLNDNSWSLSGTKE
ncbi:hypothetical protein D3C72_67560 [compost metagenome]